MTIARGATSLDYIMNAEPDQIAHAHVAVDGELNNASSRVRWSLLEPNSDSPDLSFSFSGGFWPSSLPLFHGTTCPSVFVSASMSRSFVVGGELHVVPAEDASRPAPATRIARKQTFDE